MVQIKPATLLALAALLAPAYGVPLTKRIAQTIADSTTQWVAACEAAGGAAQCSSISVTAFSTLLAAAGPCDQQNSADAMVDLAHTLNNNADMITLAQIFAQQPRNSPTSQAVPYCQTAPQNAELNGLFQCQFQSADETTFVGGLAVGSAGTVPLGLSAPLTPPGSCPANPAGPIPDGEQLVDITQNPGVAAAGGAAAATVAAATAATVAADTTAVAATTAAAATTTAAATTAAAVTTADNAAPAPAAAATTAAAATGFQLQNGQDAQALNAQFEALTATSACTAGEQACVGGAFAQCVGGAFVSTQCAGGTQCFALPLVDKAGTSIACTTPADAQARVAATGATGGVDGSS